MSRMDLNISESRLLNRNFLPKSEGFSIEVSLINSFDGTTVYLTDVSSKEELEEYLSNIKSVLKDIVNNTQTEDYELVTDCLKDNGGFFIDGEKYAIPDEMFSY